MSECKQKLLKSEGGEFRCSTCQQCRHYKEEYIRKDRLFGDLKEADWCIVRGGHIDDIGTGQDCLMFLKRLFTDNQNKTH